MILYQPETTSLIFQPKKIRYWKDNPKEHREAFPINWHADFELFYVVNGKGKLILDSEQITVCAGEVYVINPYKLHRMYSDGELFEYYYFIVPQQLFTISHINMEGRVLKTNVTDEKSVQLFNNYINEITKKNSTSVLRGVGAVCQLLAYLIDNYTVKDNDSHDSQDSSRAKKSTEIMAYIHTHYKEKLSASIISSALGYNRSYLAREFKKHTGLTITDYINMVRCVAAHDMLITSNLPVSAIAAECGYNDLSHFNNTYKRFFETTPAKVTPTSKIKSWIYK